MSSKAVMPLQDYVDICKAIRKKTGSTDVIKANEIADKISEVFEAGRKDFEEELLNGAW